MDNKTFAALSEKPFLFLWIGEVLTQIPTHLFNFFLILLVFKITNSNTAVSGAVLSFTIPAIFFGSVAGVYVDRWSKKKVLITTNLIRAGLLLVLILFIENLIAIYIISFMVSILVQFFIPAETPMIPLVVKKKNLLSANAIFGMAIFASILIAYVASGPVILFFGYKGTLIVLAALLIIGAGFISAVKPNSQKKIKDVFVGYDFRREIKHTFSVIRKTRIIARSLFLLALSQIITLIVATVAPGYANSILDIRIEEFPVYFAAPAALGMVTGAIILIKKFHSHPKDKVIAWGIVLSGLSMLLLPYGSSVVSIGFIEIINKSLPDILKINILHIMVLIAFILGIANAFVFVTANTELQEQTDDNVRGKLYGFVNTLVGFFSLVPIIVVGGLSDIIGVGFVLIGIGISLVILGLFWFNQLRAR